MRLKTTFLAFLTFFIGLNYVNASEINCLPDNYNEIMTTSDNSLIVSARCNIYSVDLNTYNATLLTTSPYVSVINSLAVDASTGWIFYVSNQASKYNWTVYGYNVYSDTHKNFGDIRNYFTQTGHANSSRGLGSGGATFYNGKLYFAMEYPTYCYSYRTSSGTVNVKDELKEQLANNITTKGSLKNTIYETPLRSSSDLGDSKKDFITVDGANIKGEQLSDYLFEDQKKPSQVLSSSMTSHSNSNYNYNNRIYLLEVCFNNLNDNTGNSSVISNAAPKYDIYGYSSFLYKGELGDIAVSDNGEIYAVTSYQIQHFDFNTNTFCWANNEDVYAQIAKDKNSGLHLLKNKKYCSHSYGCYSSCTRKSFVQSYTPPAQLQTYNNIQLGSLNEISGLQAADIGRITDAADYLNFNVQSDYKIQGNIFNDENGNGTNDAGEGNLQNITLTLYTDTDNNGSLGNNDVEISNTISDSDGNYEFNNISEENVLVKVTAPANIPGTSYTLTTDEVVAVSSTTDVTGVDFGISEVTATFNISGVVWDDNNRDGVKDIAFGETYLENITVNLYEDLNENGVLDSSDALLSTTTTTSSNPNYVFNDVNQGFVILEVIKPENSTFINYVRTYDPDTGTTDPDGIYVTELTETQNDVDFGIDRLQGNSKTSVDNTEIVEETVNDLSASTKVFPNPTKYFVNIENIELANQKVNVEVLNRSGRVLITKSLDANEQGLVRLDLSRLGTGLHFLRLNINSEKVVKTIYKY